MPIVVVPYCGYEYMSAAQFFAMDPKGAMKYYFLFGWYRYELSTFNIIKNKIKEKIGLNNVNN